LKQDNVKHTIEEADKQTKGQGEVLVGGQETAIAMATEGM
jgi:hypothetical protein